MLSPPRKGDQKDDNNNDNGCCCCCGEGASVQERMETTIRVRPHTMVVRCNMNRSLACLLARSKDEAVREVRRCYTNCTGVPSHWQTTTKWTGRALSRQRWDPLWPRTARRPRPSRLDRRHRRFRSSPSRQRTTLQLCYSRIKSVDTCIILH